MQHAWATAVEAVGLHRNENLKGGEGNTDWLRFFALMGSEIAHAEKLPLVPDTPQVGSERRAELRELNEKLDALNTLDGFRHAIRATDHIARSASKFYLIQYDIEQRSVIVRPYETAVGGTTDYDIEEGKNEPTDSVLVEADRVDDLKEAYPNYFLDVALFARGLKKILRGHDIDALSVSGRPSTGAWRTKAAVVLEEWRRKRR